MTRAQPAAQAPLLEWEARYEVGVQVIDGQHREMLDLANRLLAGLRARRDHDELVGQVLSVSGGLTMAR